jgi:hypothetical protein
MSGLDHEEDEVFVPDVDTTKTTLGMSYVFADIFSEPATKHGQVSTKSDLITLNRIGFKDRLAMDRVPKLTEQIAHYAQVYKPRYIRLLPDCLLPSVLEERCAVLQKMADDINATVDYKPAFVQQKPPSPPRACYLGFVHPVLATSGMVFPCDSVVIAAAELGYRTGQPNHKFDDKWAICHWTEIAKIYEAPIRSLIENPSEICRGCLFSRQNAILDEIVNGTSDLASPDAVYEHAEFV